MTIETMNLNDLMGEPVGDPRQLDENEQKWAQFVSSLEPWRFHKLFVVGELELHDDFISGEKTLEEIGELISPVEKAPPPKEAEKEKKT
jgi:hypothetical protein